MMAEFRSNLKFRPCILPEVGKESTIHGNFLRQAGDPGSLAKFCGSLEWSNLQKSLSQQSKSSSQQ